MDDRLWIEELPLAVTVCDRDGIVLRMNRRAVETFAQDGGAGLVGTSLLSCHPEPARSHLVAMLASGEQNAYTIRKNGRKKLIYQVPWCRDGVYSGFVELSLPLPETLPHFDRDPPRG